MALLYEPSRNHLPGGWTRSSNWKGTEPNRPKALPLHSYHPATAQHHSQIIASTPSLALPVPCGLCCWQPHPGVTSDHQPPATPHQHVLQTSLQPGCPQPIPSSAVTQSPAQTILTYCGSKQSRQYTKVILEKKLFPPHLCYHVPRSPLLSTIYSLQVTNLSSSWLTIPLFVSYKWTDMYIILYIFLLTLRNDLR